MKKHIFLVIIFISAFSLSSLNSQSLTIRETIDYINTLLKTNPYTDNFLEITFNYSVDLTSNNELVVKMEFNGPFRSVIKAEISDLDHMLQEDFCRENSNSICWYCKPKVPAGSDNCVNNEIINSGGETENHYSNNICVMFSNRNKICNKLYTAFDNLFKKVLESEGKN
jgi:hypothetical protein